MGEFFTASITILGAFVVYVAGQIVNEFFIKPIVSLKEEIGKIAYTLMFYSNIYTNPTKFSNSLGDFLRSETYKRVSTELRERASQLRAKYYAVPPLSLWLLWLLNLPIKKRNVDEAANNLIILHNSVMKGDAVENREVSNEIEELLKIVKIDCLSVNLVSENWRPMFLQEN